MKRLDDRKKYGGNAMRKYYFYLLASQKRGTLYAGMTNNLRKRIIQHKEKNIPGFTNQYRLSRLVYFEEYGDVRDAIAREKQIKGWVREKKIALIESVNPEWEEIRL
ncbi:MAG: GIY-YIG nuclease family protein [Bacteroidota bacterium]